MTNDQDKAVNREMLANELGELVLEVEDMETSDFQGACTALVNKIKQYAVEGRI